MKRTGDSQLHPMAVSALDQTIASYTDWLREVVASYEICRDTGEGELITIGALSMWFGNDFRHDEIAGLLAVAVRMLSTERR